MRADRLVAILLLLQARGGMSAPELARELEVSTRTIYRDVEALGAAGVPVYAERGAGGGIRLLEGYRTDLTGLSPGEAEAVLLMGIPGPLDELGLGLSVDAAQRKLLAALPPKGRATAERVRQRLHVDPTGWDRAPRRLPWLAPIARAVWAERQLSLRYVRADNTEVDRRVHPLGLVLKAGQWYLVATGGRWEATYRVSRVRQATVLEGPARRPPGFDLTAYWSEFLEDFESRRGSVAVRLRVAPEAVDELPRVLGEAARVALAEAPTHGSPGITVDLVFESVDDARTQLLGLGPSVLVVDPPALRRELARVAAEVVAAYA